MLDLKPFPSLGAALRAALEHWADQTCLIEADRDRENCRYTYREFEQTALPLAASLQQMGFAEGHRAAILMSNQSKWLLSAYAILYSGGVLVPLDYKLSAAEQLPLLQHSHARWLVIEYHLWRALRSLRGIEEWKPTGVLVTEAPAGADLGGALRWEECRSANPPAFVARGRDDWASIVYSSGTGGRPKGCVLTHRNYLEQCQSLNAVIPLGPGMRYLSILPTNHAIDFMGGFIWTFLCGATVVHLRTLRPEFIRDAFQRYKITYVSFVPMILKNLEKGLRDRFAALPKHRRVLLNVLIRLNRSLTRVRPNVKLSRILLKDVHNAFGGELEAMVGGGAFSEPETLQFFYDLGLVVANGYGLTEAGTAITLNDLKPFRADTVGKPLPGVELRILNPDAEGVGEVAARSNTIMAQYLDDPEMTDETIVDGWLHTGDLGRLNPDGHLQLVGRKKNMIVTEGGKNIYPEDIESAFTGLPAKEFCIFAANYLWPQRKLSGEQLVMVLHPESGAPDWRQQLTARNRSLPDFKRVNSYLLWDRDFPRTASMKIKRNILAEQIRDQVDRDAAVKPL